MAPRWLLVPILLLGLASQVISQPDACASSHPAVGFVGQLATRQHRLGGTLQVVDDCTAVVSMWSYDGFAPAAFWWGSESNGTDYATLRAGRRVSDVIPFAANGGATITVKLSDGNDWDNVKVLYVWCELFDANFGEVVIGLGPSGGADTMPTVIESTDLCDTPSFDNCVELIPGRFKLYWKLDSSDPTQATSVTMMYEGVLPDSGLGYFAFGYANPSLGEDDLNTMIGADVVVAGFLESEGVGFAQDYYMTSKSQCDYSSGINTGVCPDTGLADSPTANHAELVCALRNDDGVTRVVFTKVLDSGDEYDRPWATTSAGRAVFATGPLSSASTASQPIVLYHIPQPSGALNRASKTLRVNLGVSSFTCQSGEAIMEMANAMPAMSKPAIVPVIGPDVTVFNVDTGINPNYPNPPAWGLSYRMNGIETPVIIFRVGQELVFNVTAGPSHPLYITDDVIGGDSNTQGTVYAGGASSAGSATSPYELRWTPDTNTPDVVYYQCFTHQKLGWKLIKEGSAAADSAIAAFGNMQLTATEVAGNDLPAGAERNPACTSEDPLRVAGVEVDFDCGIEVEGGGKVVWSHSPDAATVTFGVELPSSGWISLGFNPKDNPTSMTGSMAVVGQASGVDVKDLNGRSSTGIVDNATATDSLSNTAYESLDGTAAMVFTVDLNTTPLPIDVEGGLTHWIWAHGGSTFDMHSHWGSGLSAKIPAVTAVEAPVPTETSADGRVSNPLCVDGPFQIQNSEAQFECAQSISAFSDGDGRLLWTHDPAAKTVEFALSLPAEGWVGIGFQTEENAGLMIGALAVIGTSAEVAGYRLESFSPSGVIRDDGITATIPSRSFERSGDSAVLRFTVDLTSTPLPIDPEGRTYIIWALSDNDELNGHIERNFFPLVLSAGVDDLVSQVIANSSEMVHGVLMALAWVFLLPLGAAISKYIPLLGKRAYWAHLGIQMTGVALTIASLVFILIDKELPSSWLTTDGKRYDHGRVGVAVMAFAIFNPLNALLRPHPGVSLQRRAWEIAHLLIGKTALYLGAFNVFFGIYVYTVLNRNDGGNWEPWIGLCVFALCAVSMGTAVADKLIRHRADMAKLQETGVAQQLQDNKTMPLDDSHPVGQP